MDINSMLNQVWNYGFSMLMDSMGDALGWIMKELTFGSSALFDNKFIQLFLSLVQSVGWLLFIVGAVVAVLELGVKYKSDGSGADFHGLAMNLIKGLFAVALYVTAPVLLLQGCMYLSNTFLSGAGDMVSYDFGSSDYGDITPANIFSSIGGTLIMSFILLYSVCKVFFGTIKRGATLLVIITVGTFHMFSIPRGYTDAFNGWCKQVVALCFTVFMQSILLVGTFYMVTYEPNNVWIYCGTALVAAEVPRLAQQFGLDISTKNNLSQAFSMLSSAMMISNHMRRPPKPAAAK